MLAPLTIIDLDPRNSRMIEQAARLLVDGFRLHWPDAWPDLPAALAEVQECFQPGRLARAAVDENGNVLGWIGAISGYNGHAWELHPLVVRLDLQGRGIGTALVRDLEERVRQEGGLTLHLGTDDEDGMTSLADTDLYPDVVEHLARIHNLRRHPFEFYRKLGYAVVGVIPDANGPGKPDILMAKRVGFI